MLETLRRSIADQEVPFPTDSKKHRGAVAVLVKEEADDLWLLMIRRRDNPQDPWSGQMAFPGGHAEVQDRSQFETAARETLEEVGVDLHNEDFLGCLRNVEPRNAPMIVAPFVFLVHREVRPKTSREAEEILWVPLTYLLDSRNISSITVPIDNRKIAMGCYKYSDHIIWGMSFRIIREIISKITSDL